MSLEIFILTGEIQSGKTTNLIKWAANQKNVRGIATPEIDGRRCFLDLSNQDTFNMEAVDNETETIKVGRFIFSKNNFEKAGKIILRAASTPGWLVIDEIGPLELDGKGFSNILNKIIQTDYKDLKLVLVVRKKLLEEVINRFGIMSYSIFDYRV